MNSNLSWASSATETAQLHRISDISGSSSMSGHKTGNSDKQQRKNGSTRSTRTISLRLHLRFLVPWWRAEMATIETSWWSSTKMSLCSKIVSLHILSPLVPVQILPCREYTRSGNQRKGRPRPPSSADRSLLQQDSEESSDLGAEKPISAASASDPMTTKNSENCSVVAYRLFLTAGVRNRNSVISIFRRTHRSTRRHWRFLIFLTFRSRRFSQPLGTWKSRSKSNSLDPPRRSLVMGMLGSPALIFCWSSLYPLKKWNKEPTSAAIDKDWILQRGLVPEQQKR